MHVPGNPDISTAIDEQSFINFVNMMGCRFIPDELFRIQAKPNDPSPSQRRSPPTVRDPKCEGYLVNAIKPVHEGPYMWTWARCSTCQANFFIDNGKGDKVNLSHLHGVKNNTTGHRLAIVKSMLGAIFANVTYGGYSRQELINGRKWVSITTFQRYRNIIFDAIEDLSNQIMKEQMDKCVQRGGVVFEFDVGYTKRGWVATQGWCPLIDAQSGRIVKVFVCEKSRFQGERVLRKGNCDTPSGQFEGYCLRQMFEWLEAEYPELLIAPDIHDDEPSEVNQQPDSEITNKRRKQASTSEEVLPSPDHNATSPPLVSATSTSTAEPLLPSPINTR